MKTTTSFDAVEVAEAVQRELQRLAPQQQVTLDRRLAGRDRAVLARPAQPVEDALVLERPDVATAALRSRARRPSAGRPDSSSAPPSTCTSSRPSGPRYCGPTCAAICAAPSAPSFDGFQADQPGPWPRLAVGAPAEQEAAEHEDRDDADREQRAGAQPPAGPVGGGP